MSFGDIRAGGQSGPTGGVAGAEGLTQLTDSLRLFQVSAREFTQRHSYTTNTYCCFLSALEKLSSG